MKESDFWKLIKLAAENTDGHLVNGADELRKLLSECSRSDVTEFEKMYFRVALTEYENRFLTGKVFDDIDENQKPIRKAPDGGYF